MRTAKPVLGLLGGVILVGALACDQSGLAPRARSSKISASNQVRAYDKSPLEGMGLDADLGVSVDVLDHTGTFHHADLGTLNASGSVKHGTGTAPLNAVFGATIRGHIPVLETDVGRMHGKAAKRLAGTTRDGRSWAVETEASDGPAKVVRVYRDGQLAPCRQSASGSVSPTGWELVSMDLSQFRDNQRVSHTVVRANVHRHAASAQLSVRYDRKDATSVVAMFARAGAALLLPQALHAQDSGGSWLGGLLTKAGEFIGAAVTTAGAAFDAVFGYAAWTVGLGIGVTGGVIGVAVLGYEMVSMAMSPPAGAASDACAEYYDSLEADPEGYDPEMEDLCGS